MKTEKAYVIGCLVKDAKEYFKGQQVLEGTYNGKNAVYISSYYSLDVELYEVYSANPGNRFLGNFIPTALVDISDIKGKVMVAK